MSDAFLTRQHDGRTLVVRVGDAVVIVLEESPTTGYTWSDRSEGDALEPVADEFTPAQPGAVGGTGEHRWRYVARRPGRMQLSLALGQAWASTAAPADRFSVTVEAVDG